MDINRTPTKGNLIQIEKTLELSKDGYQLMDKKRIILMNEISRLTDEATKTQNEIKEAYKEAYDKLRKAEEAVGLYALNRISAAIPIEESLTIHVKSVMGSEVPNVSIEDHPLDPDYSLQETSLEVDEARFAFVKLMKLQVKLAGIENAAYRLAQNIQKTKKRVNALENIMIPSLEEVRNDINSELEEKEREDFIRLKVVKRILAKKSKAKAEALKQ